ncbi:hypothetical protein X777_02302 [Ooceraea biroi]|uniref:Uncharacterized protein n=1 Tax=Ooceraea biroi TaxID=2015173 RepID=A0A026WL83_OOCBI|nr:hypothetical protein X777_02302 [Ooceraea biroi]
MRNGTIVRTASVVPNGSKRCSRTPRAMTVVPPLRKYKSAIKKSYKKSKKTMWTTNAAQQKS